MPTAFDGEFSDESAEIADPRARAEDVAQRLGRDHPVALKSALAAVDELIETERFDDAEAVAEGVLPRLDAVLGRAHPDTLGFLSALVSLAVRRHDAAAADEAAAELVERRIAQEGEHAAATFFAREQRARAAVHIGSAVVGLAAYDILVTEAELALGELDPTVLIILEHAARARLHRGDPEAARESWSELLDRSARAFGPLDPVTIDARARWGLALAGTGHAAESVALLRRVRDDRREVFGPDHPSTLDAWDDYAIALGESGELAAAETEYSQLLPVMERALGPGDPAALFALRSSAQLLRRAGERGAALDRFRALAAREAAAGRAQESPALRTRAMIALLVLESGDAEDAAAQFAFLASDASETLGADDVFTLDIREDHAHALAAAGQTDAAIAAYTEVIAAMTRALEPADPVAVTALRRFAAVLGGAHRSAEQGEVLAMLVERTAPAGGSAARAAVEDLADWQLAVGRGTDALAGYRSLLERETAEFGAEHAFPLMTRTSIARALRRTGRPDEARAELEAILPMFEAATGPDDPRLLDARSVLAMALSDLGAHEDALLLQRLVRESWTERSGPESPAALDASNVVALTLINARRYEEALIELGRLREIYERLRGSEDAVTMRVRGNIALVMYRMGRSDESTRDEAELLAEQERVLGADHPETIQGRHNLGIGLLRENRAEEAYAQLQAAFSARVRLLGAEDPLTLTSLGGVASALHQLGRTAEARTAFEALRAGRQRSLGIDHPLTHAAEDEVAYLFAREGDTEAALGLYESLLERIERLRGADDPELVDYAENYATVLTDAGRPGDAVPILRTLLERRVAMLGMLDPGTRNTRARLARALLGIDDLEGARALMRELREAAASADDTDALLQTLYRLVRFEMGGEKLDEAIVVQDEIIEVLRRVHGSAAEQTLDAIDDRYELLLEGGRNDDVIADATAHDAHIRDQLGEDHPLLIFARFRASLAYARAHRHAEALEWNLAHHDAARRIRGVNSPAELRAAIGVARAYAALDETTTALAHTRAALARTLGVDEELELMARQDELLWLVELNQRGPARRSARTLRPRLVARYGEESSQLAEHDGVLARMAVPKKTIRTLLVVCGGVVLLVAGMMFFGTR